ncbi:MAG: hypothetical protein NVSMB23_20190 [Myxococcales bacterium]
MPMTLHEMHPALVHAPLALLPAATAVDLCAALRDDRPLGRAGLALWTAGCAGATLAAISGLAASQEVKADDARARQMMAVHGAVNAGVLAAALALTGYRATHRPTIASSLIGLTACAAAVYTAYLGGEMVYGLGLGVKPMPASGARGARDATPVLSLRAPGKLARDAAHGVAWLLRQAGALARGQEKLRPGALVG